METDGPGPLASLSIVPNIDVSRCSGCGRCVAACPPRLITLEVTGHRKVAALINADLCTKCGQCARSCLLNAFVTTG